MTKLLLLILLLVVVAVLTWRYFSNRRQRVCRLAPHERWPEILHWQVGDKFAVIWNMRHTEYNLIAVQDDGYAVVDFLGEREWTSIGNLVGKNVSLRTRQANASLQNSTEYMELLHQFHLAYAELEARDRLKG